MAEVADLSAIMSLEEELTCSICLCPFVCPVTIPCGHNFCQDCLLTTWKDSYSCPQCRTHFATKPELKKNTVLSTVVETFMRSSMKSDPGPTTEEKEEEETAVKEEPVKPPAVMCDTCMEVKAVNTCLTCMASFCEQHVKPHRENPIFGSHQLGEPLLDLRERICPDHHKLMEFFCAEHGRCICGYCLQQAHKGCRFSTPDEQRALQESDMRTKLSLLDRKIGRNQSVLCQTQELQNKLKESVSSRKQFLESEYRQIRELLDREEREAANAVDREQENCQAKLQTHVKNFDKNVEKLSGARDRINDLLGRSQSLAFLQASVDLPSQANFDPYTPKMNLDSQAVIASQTFTVALKEFLLHIMRQPVEARLQILRPDPSSFPPNNPPAAKSETYTVPLCGYSPFDEMFGVPVGLRHFRSPSPGAALRAGQRKPRSDKKADQKDKHNKKPPHGPRESPIPPKPKEHPKSSSEEPGNQKKAGAGLQGLLPGAPLLGGENQQQQLRGHRPGLQQHRPQGSGQPSGAQRAVVVRGVVQRQAVGVARQRGAGAVQPGAEPRGGAAGLRRGRGHVLQRGGPGVPLPHVRVPLRRGGVPRVLGVLQRVDGQLVPSLFGLTQPYPEPAVLRVLTLTAKVVQNLANFTLFGEKEEYMLFMNDFLQQHWEKMRAFLQTVSNPDNDVQMTSFDGYVDLPLRLAVLHGLLVDIISQMEQDTIDKLHPLPSILNQITQSLGPAAPLIAVSSNVGLSKPTYVPPKDLGKYSPLHTSLQQLPTDPKGGQGRDAYERGARERKSARERKPVSRTQSAPHRRPVQPKELPRQASTDDLVIEENEPLEQDARANPPLDISAPHSVCVKPPPAPVPWIKDSQNKEPHVMTTEHEQTSLLDRHAEELSELRLGVEQVTERELEMAKRLEDFIVQSQDQNALLQAEVGELRNLLAVRDEQLASATFRLGVIEEEKEEDERKLSVAVAAAERMNILEEQFADLLKDLHQLSGQNSIQAPEADASTHINNN